MMREAPQRLEPESLADYFEAMAKVMFESGLSWKVVETKWSGIRAALAGCDPAEVAEFAPPDVEQLVGDPRMIRNRRKIEAVVENARTMLALDREFGGFRRYLRSHGTYELTASDLKRRFRFLGDSGLYHYLWVVGEDVPPYEEWCQQHQGRPSKDPRRGSRR